jgi:hypothetical protein
MKLGATVGGDSCALESVETDGLSVAALVERGAARGVEVCVENAGHLDRDLLADTARRFAQAVGAADP